MGLLQEAEDCLLKRSVSPELRSQKHYSRPLLAIACGVDPKSGLAAHLDVYAIGVTRSGDTQPVDRMACRGKSLSTFLARLEMTLTGQDGLD